MLFFAASISSADSSADERLSEKALIWLKQFPACPEINRESVRPDRYIQAGPDKKNKIFFDFSCRNGKKQERISVVDEKLNVLFSSDIKNNQLIGTAQFIEKPGKTFVWAGGKLYLLDHLRKLSTSEAGGKSGLLNGVYRIYYEISKTHQVVSFKNGILHGERINISRYVPPARLAQSPFEEQLLTIDRNIPFRARVDNFADGLFQYVTDSYFAYGKWNNLNRLDPEEKVKGAHPSSSCELSPPTSLKELFKNIDEAYNSKDDHSWLADADSNQFRKQTECLVAGTNINRRSEGGIVYIESSCYRPGFTGFVRLYDKTKGSLINSVEYRDGKIDGLLAHGSDGVIEHQAMIQSGNIQSICSTVMNIKALTDRKNALKRSGAREGLFGFSGSLATRDESSAGIWYSPNFYTRDIGGGGFFMEGELRKREGEYLGRVSAGPGVVAMFFSGYGTLGLGFDSSKLRSVDMTLGVGFLVATVFVRPVYQFEQKNILGEAGIKLILPLGF